MLFSTRGSENKPLDKYLSFDEQTKTLSMSIASEHLKEFNCNFIEKMYLTYATVESLEDFFKRLERVTVTQNGFVLHNFQSESWSTFLSLHNDMVMKNKLDGMLYIPMLTGFVPYLNFIDYNPDLTEQPAQKIVITLQFRQWLNEQTRCGLLCNIKYVTTRPQNPYYYTLTDMVYVNMPSMDADDNDQKDFERLISINWADRPDQIPSYLAQLVFYVPHMNAWINSGELRVVSKPESGSENHVPQTKCIANKFDDVYLTAALDKVVNEMELPKQSILTLTQLNYDKVTSCSEPWFEQLIHGNERYQFYLKLNVIPKNNRPKESKMQLFGVLVNYRPL